ncbi:MAG: hypothetical protein ABW208_05760, partial [Pyrinomonadaceae bacterium]
WWVNNEIEVALQKEELLWKEKGEETLALIPLDLDGYLFKPEFISGKAAQLRARLAADFTGWKRSNKKFDEQLEKLMLALRVSVVGR